MTKTTFYTTIENQGRADGYGLLYDHFTDENRAYNKFYTILAAAAISDIPYHAGYLLRDDGVVMEGKVFDRREPESPVAEEQEAEQDGE